MPFGDNGKRPAAARGSADMGFGEGGFWAFLTGTRQGAEEIERKLVDNAHLDAHGQPMVDYKALPPEARVKVKWWNI